MPLKRATGLSLVLCCTVLLINGVSCSSNHITGRAVDQSDAEQLLRAHATREQVTAHLGPSKTYSTDPHQLVYDWTIHHERARSICGPDIGPNSYQRSVYIIFKFDDSGRLISYDGPHG